MPHTPIAKISENKTRAKTSGSTVLACQTGQRALSTASPRLKHLVQDWPQVTQDEQML